MVMAMAEKYPIGVQNFTSLRENGYTYVDKSEYIEKLITRGKYYFLSRPRRFGKSLLLSTIEAYYQGRRDLFEGLAISRGDHDWQPHPVLHIAFNAHEYIRPDSLLEKFGYDFNEWEKLYGTELRGASHSERFRYFIKQAYAVTGQKVVILIDEYDKPLLDTAGNKELQDIYRSQLKAFYGNLKNCDQYIEFAMLTGVSRFGKLSIFSDLNNLQDISLSEEYSAICGMTIEEIRDNFDAGVRQLAVRNEMSVDEAYGQLKKNYDGYHFSPTSPDIYNPFSLLSALSSGYIGAYWFSTGTPSFLVEMIRRMQIDLRDLEHTNIRLDHLMDSPFDQKDVIPFLYQIGYLTIRSYDRRFRTVQLDYPNEEVEQSFLDILTDARS